MRSLWYVSAILDLTPEEDRVKIVPVTEEDIKKLTPKE